MNPRIQQLINLGIIHSEGDISPGARQLIENMSQDEFDALITTRAKIVTPGHRDGFDESIQKHGF